MRTAYYVVWYGLWVMAPLLQFFLAVVMVRRKLRKEFPLFFAYTIFQVASFILKFFFYHYSQLQYVYVYWVTGALGVGLALCVIYEIFASVFRPYESLRDLGSTLFRWAALVMVLVAAIMAINGGQSVPNQIMSGILTMERSVRVMQCGLVLFLFLFARSFGLTIRNHLFGIAVGFGVFAAVELIYVSLLALGIPSNDVLRVLKSSSYDIAVLIWTGYMLSREPARAPALYPVAERWNYALSGANSSAAAPFIPLLEDTVDRVLTKTNGKNGHNGHGNGNGNGDH